MSPKPSSLYLQSAVIPYRVTGGRVEVLLITSVNRGRWIVPKGVVEPDLTPLESALKEAREEAGVSGRARETAVGSYQYRKWGGTCSVTVFLLEVQTIDREWPEAHLRRRRWLPIDRAVQLIEEDELRDLIRLAGEWLNPGSDD